MSQPDWTQFKSSSSSSHLDVDAPINTPLRPPYGMYTFGGNGQGRRGAIKLRGGADRESSKGGISRPRSSRLSTDS